MARQVDGIDCFAVHDGQVCVGPTLFHRAVCDRRFVDVGCLSIFVKHGKTFAHEPPASAPTCRTGTDD
jgi:hypothetical protein